VVARFSARNPDRPWDHPASYTLGTGSFQGVKRARRGVDDPSPSSAEVKERAELYLYSSSGPSWPVLGYTLPLPLPSFFFLTDTHAVFHLLVCALMDRFPKSSNNSSETTAFIYEGWNFNSGNYLFTTDTK